MRHVLVTTAALIVTACGGGSPSPIQSSPIAVTPTISGPTANAATNWSVTQRFVSVTGPDNCWVRGQRSKLTGAVFPDLQTTITRSGDAITVRSSWFQVNYAGTARGSEFQASGDAPLEGGGTDCSGTPVVQLAGVSSLSGRFAPDEQTASMTEVNTYPLRSGETVSYTWEWEVKRRP
jgi:hypothetical protein